MTTHSYVQQQIDFYKQKGAEFIGAQCQLRTYPTKGIPLHDLRNVFLGSPLLPDSWAPDSESDVTLWLHTMREVAAGSKASRYINMALRGSESLPEPLLEIDPTTHGGFVQKRLPMDRSQREVCTHKVFHFTKQMVEDEEGVKRMNNLEVDGGYLITLVRTEGTVDQDCNNTNKWGIKVTDNEGNEIMPGDMEPPYRAFLRTVGSEWKKKRTQIYSTSEVRSILLDVLKNGLDVDNIDSGIYFVAQDKLDLAHELKDRLKDLDSGLRLWLNDIPRWVEPSANNDMFEQTQLGVTDSIVSELRLLLDDLQSRKDADSKTRESTIMKRDEELRGISQKIKKYMKLHLMTEDIFREQFNEAKSLITQLKADAASDDGE